MFITRLLVLLVLVVSIQAADEWAMRWRVYSDADAGITVRYPYSFSAPDQYKGELVRNRRGGFVADEGEEREMVIDGKKVRVIVSAIDRPRAVADMKIFSVAEAELPPEAVGKSLAAIASILAKTTPE